MDDDLPEANWLEFAKNYHSIASRPGYHIPRESQYRRKVLEYGPKQELRSTHHSAARDSTEDDFAGGHPERD